MFETLFQKEPALFIPVVALLGTTLVFTVWILAHYWRRTRQTELEITLKQDMLNRGLPASDIERILLATTHRDQDQPLPEPPQIISDNEYALVEKMLDEGYSVEDVEKLIRAFKEGKADLRSHAVWSPAPREI